MFRTWLGYSLAILFATFPAIVAAQDPGNPSEFAKGVRDADPQSPEDEWATFTVPEGFQVQLFAAEPAIAKPLNLAFDTRGRLWVTDTLEYPYPVEVGTPGRDTIKVLEDTDGDGRADRVTTFADGLNIPIGLYPYQDGVICYSIPNIWLLRDTDGDGKCDHREVLYGPFDHTRDTHGMCNAFTRGYDGWMYACHGFNNQSSVRGSDGSVVTMHSGNTFRFRLDGSRIEHFTHGQVNPFGMSYDARGDLFTADCHTKPVTLLLHGGYYESFGKPHDGLGFVPNVMEHLHGSTAIGGIAISHTDNGWPVEYQNNTFGGNVMTSRINRNSLHSLGSSIRAQEESDLLISRDSWFRPVDLQMGPDGAMYVADFYNRIIGHYEVPLNHPGRDRHRGRIWKIAFVGTAHDSEAPSVPIPSHDLTKDEPQQLVSRFRSNAHRQRMLAMDRLVDEDNDHTRSAVRAALTSDSEQVRLHCLWTLSRLQDLTRSELQRALNDSSELVRTHVQRILGSEGVPADLTMEQRCDWIERGLTDPEPFVRRAAATACYSLRNPRLVASLLRCLQSTASDDVHLRHALRIGLKHQLTDAAILSALAGDIEPAHLPQVADVFLAIPSAAAADFLVSHLQQTTSLEQPKLVAQVQHAAGYISPDAIPDFIQLVRDQFNFDSDFHYELVRSIAASLRQREVPMPDSLRDWGAQLADAWLDPNESLAPLSWQELATTGANQTTWDVSTKRNSADGQTGSTLWSSFPHGEPQTGIYRSAAFPLAETFAFYIAGHDGPPNRAPQGKNLVRLRDSDTHEIVHSWKPPRQDVAVLRSWETQQHAGRQVYLELIDGDSADAYAWLAVGRFRESRLDPNSQFHNYQRACELVRDFRLQHAQPVLHQLLRQSAQDLRTRVLVARTIANLWPGVLRRAVAESLTIATLPEDVLQTALHLLLDDNVDPAVVTEYLAAALKFASSAEQQQIAESLAADGRGVDALLRLAKDRAIALQCLTLPAVRSKINAVAQNHQKTAMASLTANIPSEAETVNAAIQQQKSHFLLQGGLQDVGKAVFDKQCAICHQVGGQGKQVGPNLDGIGLRGLDRIIEDVLAPNRNIDVAFQAETIVTIDGLAITGLVRDNEVGVLHVVNSRGNLQSIPTSQIEERHGAAISPMPANFSDLLSKQELANLLSYLLSLK